MNGPIAPGIVYLWEGSLAVSEQEMARARELLCEEEHARADRFGSEVGRRRYTVARARLRELLARLTGTDPRHLRFTYGERGRPELATELLADDHTRLRKQSAPCNPPVFNLSHSGDRVVMAVQAEGQIGVDIEELRPLRRVARLARRFLSPDEAELVLGESVAKRDRLFLRLWTRKEALLKGLGGGFAIPPRSFSVPTSAKVLQGEVCGHDGVELAGWTVSSLASSTDAVAALATDRPFEAISVIGG